MNENFKPTIPTDTKRQENNFKNETKNSVFKKAENMIPNEKRFQKNITRLKSDYFNYLMDKYKQTRTEDNYKLLSQILENNNYHFLKQVHKLKKPDPELDREIIAHYLLEQKYDMDNRLNQKNKELDEKIKNQNQH